MYDRLTKDGHTVTVVQNPTISLEGDVATTKQALDAHDGPAILVGHSYGGAVITEAGNHPAVKALVYIAAFAPDKGESVNTLIADPPGAPVPPILPPKDGFLFLDRDKFAASFASDVPDEESAFMADSQVPWGVDALSGAVSCPVWRAKPSWYLVTTDDRMIPPPRAAGHVRANRRDNRRGRGESRRLPIAARRRRRAHLRGGRSDHVVLAADPADLHPPAGTAVTPAVPAPSRCTARSLPAPRKRGIGPVCHPLGHGQARTIGQGAQLSRARRARRTARPLA